MDEQYKNSLEFARKCETNDIIRLENLINNKPDQDLTRLKNFINFTKDDNSKRYLNAFEILNVNEDSISELIAWLLDQTKNKDLDKPIIKIKQYFCEKFIEEIGINISDKEKIYCELRQQSKGQSKKPDIIIKIKNDNNDKIICIIENKKNAKLSCTKGIDGNRRTQLEHYKNNENLIAEKYIFLVDSTSDYLESKIETHIKNKTWCKTEPYESIKAKKFRYLLNQLGYIPLEHDFVVLTLYEALKEYYKDAFINEQSWILKATSYSEMNDCLKNLLGLFKEDMGDKFKKIINNNRYQKYNEITFEQLKTELKNDTDLAQVLKTIGKNAILFHNNLTTNDMDIILKILCQYIEFWELHSSIGNGKDNLCGLTKIIDGDFIYNSCNRISKNKIFKKLPHKVQMVVCCMLCQINNCNVDCQKT